MVYINWNSSSCIFISAFDWIAFQTWSTIVRGVVFQNNSNFHFENRQIPFISYCIVVLYGRQLNRTTSCLSIKMHSSNDIIELLKTTTIIYEKPCVIYNMYAVVTMSIWFVMCVQIQHSHQVFVMTNGWENIYELVQLARLNEKNKESI